MGFSVNFHDYKSEVVIPSEYHIEQIPTELILKILQYLDVKEMRSFKLTCRRFREITFLLPLNSTYKLFDGVLRFGPVDENFKTLFNSQSYSSNFFSKIFIELIGEENLDLEKIKLLLALPEVNLTYNQNNAIMVAANRGHIEIVELLFTDKRFNTKDISCFGDVVREAINNQHFDIANFLLSHPDVNCNFSNLIKDDIRISNLNLSLVKFLLKYPMRSSAINKNKLVLLAVKYGRRDILKLLLTDPLIDPSYDKNHAIKIAIEDGWLEIVRLLLADQRVTSSLDFAEAIFLAQIQNEYQENV